MIRMLKNLHCKNIFLFFWIYFKKQFTVNYMVIVGLLYIYYLVGYESGQWEKFLSFEQNKVDRNLFASMFSHRMELADVPLPSLIDRILSRKISIRITRRKSFQANFLSHTSDTFSISIRYTCEKETWHRKNAIRKNSFALTLNQVVRLRISKSSIREKSICNDNNWVFGTFRQKFSLTSLLKDNFLV